MKVTTDPSYAWFRENGWKPFDFQESAWKAVNNGKEGLVNAPTGSGKTYSLLLPILVDAARRKQRGQLHSIWITPIRALAQEIRQSTEKAISGMGLSLRVEVRTGDTPSSRKKKILNDPPDLLITTPESLHIFLTYKHYPKYFGHLRFLIVDEWHELMGSKRGVQVELALSRIKSLSESLRVWGISATIGNMKESLETLLGGGHGVLIRSRLEKKIEISSVFR